MALANTIADIGQRLGLPELGISERISGSKTQTRPSYTGDGLFGSGGYIATPIPQSGQIKGVNTSGPPPQYYQNPGAYPLTQQAIQNFNTGGQVQGVARTGGGGGGAPRGFDPTRDDINDPRWADYRAQLQAQDAANLQGQVDSAYNESYNILGDIERGVRANEQNLYDTATKPYDAQRPLVDQQYQQNVATNRTQQETERFNEQNALASARRLFNELNQGVRQRFGGANSAGDFANEFYGREFARNTGNIQQTAGQNIKALTDQATQMKEKYDGMIQNLELQKQTALAQARDEFSRRIQEINNTRLGLAQNKAQLKLQALQELRTRAYQIQDQATQYMQQLGMMREQVNLQTQQQLAQAGQQFQPIQTQGYASPSFSTMGGTQGGGANIFSTVSGSLGRSQDDYMRQLGLG